MSQIKTASFLFVTATLIYINFTEIQCDDDDDDISYFV